MAEMEGPDIFAFRGVSYSEAVAETGHVSINEHDDGVFEFCMANPVSMEEEDGVTCYTLDDGTVFIQREGGLMTE
jgi:hypothetical protein